MTVVLLHGLPLDGRMWEPQLGALGDQASAPTLYDVPGETMDAWAEAVLDSVAGELVLVGASMGGYCALAIARRSPTCRRRRARRLAGGSRSAGAARGT